MDWSGYQGKKGVVRQGFDVEIQSAPPNAAPQIFKTTTDPQGVFIVTGVPRSAKLSYKSISHRDFCNKGCASGATIFTPGKTTTFLALSEHIYMLSKDGHINFKWIDTWNRASQATVDKATKKYVTTAVEAKEYLGTLEL